MNYTTICGVQKKITSLCCSTPDMKTLTVNWFDLSCSCFITYQLCTSCSVWDWLDWLDWRGWEVRRSEAPAGVWWPGQEVWVWRWVVWTWELVLVWTHQRLLEQQEGHLTWLQEKKRKLGVKITRSYFGRATTSWWHHWSLITVN